MNLNELAARLIKGEDLHTEFKERLIHADDLAASIIAFANTDGGQMIFGVNDEREITGLGEETDHVLQFIDGKAQHIAYTPSAY
jgi:ATP-dependent DNA helicase RecG